VLLDTSGLLAFHNDAETDHFKARSLFRGNRQKLTHSYVLAEFVALAQARGLPRAPVLAFLAALMEHPRVEVVWVEETLYQRAIALLAARPDKSYSLCDTVSFVLMREHSISDALTTDHHFEQEGFLRLLEP
jgi:predicted nucleic acid-binding protein